MKKGILLSLLFTVSAGAQQASVEKSIYGIQTGLLGVWVHNEARLSNSIALRTELGFDAGLLLNTWYDKVDFLMAPGIAVEPRWYYNLNRRARKEKRIAGNSGNFVSLLTTFHPDWFVISNNDNINVVNQIAVMPTWGIRRGIGSHFTYEAGFGMGYRYAWTTVYGNLEEDSEPAVNLHLRVGYKF